MNKEIVRINAVNSGVNFGIVVSKDEDVFIVKVCKKDDNCNWLGNPYYRIFGSKLVTVIN